MAAGFTVWPVERGEGTNQCLHNIYLCAVECYKGHVLVIEVFTFSVLNTEVLHSRLSTCMLWSGGDSKENMS